MKKIVLSVTTILLLFVAAAQVPQALNYQAVARNNVGQIVPSQNVGVRFSIHEGTANGNVVYQETHSTLTNNFGLFTLAIGRGTVVSGTFSSINWGTGDKFLQVEIAPAGGNNYTVQGTTQFLSVPFALYSAKTTLLAGNNTILVANGNTITGNYQAANNTILVNGNTIAGNYAAANNTILINGNTIAGNYAAANNTILVNGNTIAGNYAAANNTILVNGNTIAGNYQAANNTVLVTGNTIAGNYQAANNTVLVTGNTIAANYQAGTGINIAGNVISATGGNSLWTADANGMHNTTLTGSVGIGANSEASTKLTIRQAPTAGLSGALLMISSDTWQTVMRIQNESAAREWQMTVSGTTNFQIPTGSFALYNNSLNNLVYIADPATSFLAVGTPNGGVIGAAARSRLHVYGGDVNIEQIGSGIIMKSPNGQCWRITIDNGGNLVRTSITCP